MYYSEVAKGLGLRARLAGCEVWFCYRQVIYPLRFTFLNFKNGYNNGYTLKMILHIKELIHTKCLDHSAWHVESAQ